MLIFELQQIVIALYLEPPRLDDSLKYLDILMEFCLVLREVR